MANSKVRSARTNLEAKQAMKKLERTQELEASRKLIKTVFREWKKHVTRQTAEQRTKMQALRAEQKKLAMIREEEMNRLVHKVVFDIWVTWTGRSKKRRAIRRARRRERRERQKQKDMDLRTDSFEENDFDDESTLDGASSLGSVSLCDPLELHEAESTKLPPALTISVGGGGDAAEIAALVKQNDASGSMGDTDMRQALAVMEDSLFAGVKKSVGDQQAKDSMKKNLRRAGDTERTERRHAQQARQRRRNDARHRQHIHDLEAARRDSGGGGGGGGGSGALGGRPAPPPGAAPPPRRRGGGGASPRVKASKLAAAGAGGGPEEHDAGPERASAAAAAAALPGEGPAVAAALAGGPLLPALSPLRAPPAGAAAQQQRSLMFQVKKTKPAKKKKKPPPSNNDAPAGGAAASPRPGGGGGGGGGYPAAPLSEAQRRALAHHRGVRGGRGRTAEAAAAAAPEAAAATEAEAEAGRRHMRQLMQAAGRGEHHRQVFAAYGYEVGAAAV